MSLTRNHAKVDFFENDKQFLGLYINWKKYTDIEGMGCC